MNKRHIRRWACALACLLLIAGLGASLLPAATAAPDEGGRVAYRFSVDDINGQSSSGSIMGVVRDMKLSRGEPLEAEGWLATDAGVSAYEYAWVPAGGGPAAWQAIPTAEIFGRGDLSAAGVPHKSGHKTAGFRLTISPPADTPDGLYDVYVRAVDGDGYTCDMLALLSLVYGDPDVDNGETRRVSFTRMIEEGEVATVGDAVLTPEGVTMTGEARVRLGSFHLDSFERIRITYIYRKTQPLGEGRRPILGLKSSPSHGYGTAGKSYNLTDSLVYGALESDPAGGVLELDLSACRHDGEVWLTGYLGGEITVTGVELVYNGFATSRVAARIRLSADLTGYLNGYNHSKATGVTDPVLGDVLRLEVINETNDPFVFFSAGALLEAEKLRLDADEYQYVVVLCRALPQNRRDTITFYLCSGPITGATEDCTHSFPIQKDGEWHYYLLDLSETRNWGGIINGWRFDFLNGDSNVGDAVEFASVQFFRTRAAAEAAAARDPASLGVHSLGDPAVYHDVSEERGDPAFAVDPDDAYTVTEADTRPSASPETDTGAPTEPNPPAETAATSPAAGCSAALAPPALLLIPVALPLLLHSARKDAFASRKPRSTP